MSFSTGFKDRNQNPCQAWLEFGNLKDSDKKRIGEHPCFYRYDKETKANVVCDLTQGFIIIDPFLIKITGFNRGISRNVLSNEVRSVKDKLKVVSYLADKSKKVWFEGSYQDFKASHTMEGIGAKYTNSIYIAIAGEHVGLGAGLVLANLSASGSLCDAWMTFSNKIKTKDFQVKHVRHDPTSWTTKVNGDVTYEVATLGFGADIDPATASAAMDLDITFQEYLQDYLGHGEPLDHTTSQEVAYEETSQEVDFSAAPAALLFKLKDGRKLQDVPLAELLEMSAYLDERGLTAFTNETCKNVKIALDHQQKKANVAKEHELNNEEIPF